MMIIILHILLIYVSLIQIALGESCTSKLETIQIDNSTYVHIIQTVPAQPKCATEGMNFIAKITPIYLNHDVMPIVTDFILNVSRSGNVHSLQKQIAHSNYLYGVIKTNNEVKSMTYDEEVLINILGFGMSSNIYTQSLLQKQIANPNKSIIQSNDQKICDDSNIYTYSLLQKQIANLSKSIISMNEKTCNDSNIFTHKLLQKQIVNLNKPIVSMNKKTCDGSN
eukprot:452144_1